MKFFCTIDNDWVESFGGEYANGYWWMCPIPHKMYEAIVGHNRQNPLYVLKKKTVADMVKYQDFRYYQTEDQWVLFEFYKSPF